VVHVSIILRKHLQNAPIRIKLTEKFHGNCSDNFVVLTDIFTRETGKKKVKTIVIIQKLKFRSIGN